MAPVRVHSSDAPRLNQLSRHGLLPRRKTAHEWGRGSCTRVVTPTRRCSVAARKSRLTSSVVGRFEFALACRGPISRETCSHAGLESSKKLELAHQHLFNFCFLPPLRSPSNASAAATRPYSPSAPSSSAPFPSPRNALLPSVSRNCELPPPAPPPAPPLPPLCCGAPPLPIRSGRCDDRRPLANPPALPRTRPRTRPDPPLRLPLDPEWWRCDPPGYPPGYPRTRRLPDAGPLALPRLALPAPAAGCPPPAAAASADDNGNTTAVVRFPCSISLCISESTRCAAANCCTDASKVAAL